MSTISYSKTETDVKILSKITEKAVTPNARLTQLEANQATGTPLMIDNVFMQGCSWDSTTDTCTRLGSLKGLPLGIWPGLQNLPILNKSKTVLLKADGTENYVLDDIYLLNKTGMTPLYEGAATNVLTGKLIDTNATFITKGVVAGLCIKNYNTATVYLITAVDSETQLSVFSINHIDFALGNTYYIGTAKFDGSDGDVMQRFDKFYEYHNLVGTTHTRCYSEYNLPGYNVHPMFYKNGIEVDKRYLPCFEGSMWDASTGAMATDAVAVANSYAAGDKLCSLPFQCPKVNETLAEFENMASNKGAGWTNYDLQIHSALQLFYFVAFANFNSQATIGAGRTALSVGTWVADSYIGRTGMSLGLGKEPQNVSNGGTAGYLTDFMSFLNIENFYGNVWKMLSKIAWDGRWTGAGAAQPVYITNNDNYATQQDNINKLKLMDAAYIGASSGYISNIENNFAFLPKAAIGSSTTKLCDYYYQYSEVGLDYWRVILVGGSASNGGKAGAFSLHAGAWSNADVSIAGRLCF